VDAAKLLGGNASADSIKPFHRGNDRASGRRGEEAGQFAGRDFLNVRRIELRRTEIAISLLSEDCAPEDEKDNPLVLTVPWSKTPHRRHRDVIAPEGPSRTQVLPIRTDTLVKLVTAIARGRQWLSEIEAGAATIDGSPHGRPAASATST
jgi:hypothetical protein